jgi:predicted Zn-dependent protease
VTLLRANSETTVRVRARAACPSRVHLARSGQRNAYADGRHVFLTTGILSLLRNDDELAFIIAHEMAHNILGHAAIMRGATVKKGIGRTLGRSGEIVRGTESKADALGAEMMLDAGFDPVRGVAILTRLGGADLGIALLATHEPAGQRIAAVTAIARARRSQ